MAAVARMERTGVPIDFDMLQRLRMSWGRIKTDLIGAIDKDYGVYEGASQIQTFRRLPRRQPDRLATHRDGPSPLRSDTFRDMAKRYPRLEPLKELRHALGELRLEKLAVGLDDQNRTLLSPFGASSGRNNPSNNKFIFGPRVWLRGLIRPPEGRALAYVDWKCKERLRLPARLSGDPAFLEAVQSGDPGLSITKMAGLVPPDATKQSHKTIRDM